MYLSGTIEAAVDLVQVVGYHFSEIWIHEFFLELRHVVLDVYEFENGASLYICNIVRTKTNNHR